MFCSVLSMGISGIEGYMVTVEVDCQRGIDAFELVGLPDAAVRESRERVRSAIKNLEMEWPKGRVLVNLAPADTRKTGPIYDLPILLGLLAAASWTLPAAPLSGSFPSTAGCGRWPGPFP